MEHRWGQRATLFLPVRLAWTKANSPAVMIDASASGALVRGNFRVTRGTSVTVQIGSKRVAAWIVRVAPEAVGVEWQDFAPPAVLALFQMERALARAGEAAAQPLKAVLARTSSEV